MKSLFFLSFFCDVHTLLIVRCAVPPRNSICMCSAVVPFDWRAISYSRLKQSVYSALWIFVVVNSRIPLQIFITSTRRRHLHRRRNRTISLHFIRTECMKWANINMTASQAERGGDRKHYVSVSTLYLFLSLSLSLYFSLFLLLFLFIYYMRSST